VVPKNPKSLNVLPTLQIEVLSLILGPVADGKWDRLLVFRPYTPKETIKNRIGSPWSDASKIKTIRDFDNVCLLVFVRGNEVVASALVPRNLADFHEDNDILRDQAMFEFTGKEKLVLLVLSGLRHQRSFESCGSKLPHPSRGSCPFIRPSHDRLHC